jgi:hypothetical protein
MRKLILALALLIPAPAFADGPCLSVEAWLARVADHNPTIHIERTVALNADQTAEAVKIFNETPPVNQVITADAAVVVAGSINGVPMSSVLVGFFHAGCSVGGITMSMNRLPELGA